MSRPPLPPHALRQKTVGVRLSAIEAAEIAEKASAAGVSAAEWLRLAGLAQRPVAVVPQVNRDTYRQLAGAANNLNQLIKRFGAQNLHPLVVTSLWDLVKQVQKEVITGERAQR